MLKEIRKQLQYMSEGIASADKTKFEVCQESISDSQQKKTNKKNSADTHKKTASTNDTKESSLIVHS